MAVFPVIATAVSAVFAYLVLKQYVRRRGPAQLFWGIALVMFALGSAAMTQAAFTGWTELNSRIFYLFGASLVVGYLALGTVYLLSPRAVAQAVLVFLLALTVYLVYLVFSAPVNQALLATEGWEALERPLVLRLLVGIITNGLGSLVLIGGGLYSAWVWWRRREHRERMVGNILIALGVFIVASGNTVSGLFRIGEDTLLAISIATGVLVMFIGFIEAGRIPRRTDAGTPAQPSSAADAEATSGTT